MKYDIYKLALYIFSLLLLLWRIHAPKRTMHNKTGATEEKSSRTTQTRVNGKGNQAARRPLKLPSKPPICVILEIRVHIYTYMYVMVSFDR